MEHLLFNGDTFVAMSQLEDKSIDLILCDPPYGTTLNTWDKVLPFDNLWAEYRRLLKPSGAVILFGNQPFTSHVVLSNPAWFKQVLIWNKNKCGSPGLAKIRPMQVHEDLTSSPSFPRKRWPKAKVGEDVKPDIFRLQKRGLKVSRAYYNEIDPFAAQWLRNLIDAGHIAPGDVDTRSVVDVQSSDLRGYTQIHLFAGIGVWPHALRQAGWSDDRPVITGSCPCQPFSNAGLKKGLEDERHLWPEMFRLVRELAPRTVFGEQVASNDGLAWFDVVQADLEGAGYAATAIDLCAAGFGAPHIRQRLFWVGHANNTRLEGHAGDGDTGGKQVEVGSATTSSVPICGAGDTYIDRCESGLQTAPTARQGCSANSTGRTRGFWADATWSPFRDGKRRPVEPGTIPVAYGTPSTMGLLRAYGNAIVAPVAIEFIRANIDYGLQPLSRSS